MTDIVNEPPRAHARIVYLGPVSPHWEVYGDYGDRTVLEEFRTRVLARLVLLPRDDPQFRRNRERIVRDAERERISLEWDLGIPERRSDASTRHAGRMSDAAAQPGAELARLQPARAGAGRTSRGSRCSNGSSSWRSARPTSTSSSRCASRR